MLARISYLRDEKSQPYYRLEMCDNSGYGGWHLVKNYILGQEKELKKDTKKLLKSRHIGEYYGLTNNVLKLSKRYR